MDAPNQHGNNLQPSSSTTQIDVNMYHGAFSDLAVQSYSLPDRSSSTGPVKPKRRQVKNACVACQRSCKKCDDARPCLRCVKYGIAADCVDSSRKERKKGIKRGPYKKRDIKGSKSVGYLSRPQQTQPQSDVPVTSRLIKAAPDSADSLDTQVNHYQPSAPVPASGAENPAHYFYSVGQPPPPSPGSSQGSLDSPVSPVTPGGNSWHPSYYAFPAAGSYEHCQPPYAQTSYPAYQTNYHSGYAKQWDQSDYSQHAVYGKAPIYSQ